MKRILAAAFMVLIAPWALAQGTPNTFELTPTIGYWFGDHMPGGTISGVNFDTSVDNATSFGLRAAYRFSPHWSVEGFLAWEQAGIVATQPGVFAGQTRIGTMDVGTAEVNMEYAFGHSRFVPFIAGGVGGMHLSPSLYPGVVPGANPNLSSAVRFVGDFGTGFKIFFSPDVALRFDLRWHSVDLNNYSSCDWWYDYCGGYYNENWLTFTELGLGVTFVL
jgi:hypothetical protein